MSPDGVQRLDREFARFAQSGDPAALARVFDGTARELLRVARYLTGDAHAAEDAVQATFLVAIQQRERYEVGRPVMPWLVGILTHRVHTQRRSERRARARARASDATAEEPSAAAEQAELRRELASACGRLPDPYRQVLQLHVEHGLSGAEIARVLRRSPVTVRAQIARGLARLRRLLPKGVGLALALGVVSRRSLAALRGRVLAAAGGDAALLSLPVSASWLGGALLVNKTKMTVLFAALLLAPLGVLVGSMWGPSEAVEDAPAGNVVAAAPSAVAPAELPPTTPTLLERQVAPLTIAPGSILVRVRWKDGAPAAGRGVRTRHWGSSWFSDPRTLVTDERGECRLERAAPGRYSAYCPRRSRSARR
jgi:RNA polymerase sigma factor (sigma-70 family)